MHIPAKYIPHVEGALAMGFRVLIPDLPSVSFSSTIDRTELYSDLTCALAQHGRSTGLHVYLDAPWELTEGLHALLTDVTRLSDEPPRKVFLSGSSLGGWTR